MGTALTNWNATLDSPAFRPLLDRAFAWPTVWDWAEKNMEGGMNNLALDMYDDDNNNLVIETALPGMSANNVDISVQDGMLSIRAETKRMTEKKEADYYLCERHYGAMHRTVRLPTDVMVDKAKANFDNGVMRIMIPHTAKTRSKKTRIKVS